MNARVGAVEIIFDKQSMFCQVCSTQLFLHLKAFFRNRGSPSERYLCSFKRNILRNSTVTAGLTH